ncbi:hypothetical protein [Tabrizicola sp.]|uniref:hypothetical protein n=1 Tax=Tabrizicola sp. TaxID=2005166 RepID=UPI002FDCAF64
MIRALLLVLALAAPVTAETARVRSGEHGDFTRLVIELPTAEAWTLGRTETGYAFAAGAESQPQYDLSRVWDLIPRSRLRSVAQDRQTGALTLDLGCDCHIFPFETRPGTVVLDIKPGPAPTASTFEDPFVMPGAKVAAKVAALPAYDWLADREAGGPSPVPSPPRPLPLKTGSVSLEPLRDALLQEIARGAADGIVDMELPGKPPAAEEIDSSDLPWSNIHIGELPGVIVTDPDDFIAGSRPEHACADPALLDLPAWGGTSPPQELLADSRSGLFGELDTPEPEAILRAVRLLLYLGFGAEARQTADLAGSDAPDDLRYYRSMAKIIDGESDADTPFATMLDCDGPAALWAALAHDRLPADKGTKRDAILQAFIALPAHLRQHLGPALAEKFLARDDGDAARMIRDAMERAPDADAAAVALLDAKAELHGDNPRAARTHAEAAVALDGDGPDGLVTLVESHFRSLDPLGPEIAEALRALQGETAGTAEGPGVDRAVVLALALSNQIEAAFHEASAKGGVLADLWRVTEDRATDDEFLKQAVLPTGATAPMVDASLGQTIADRLLSLGFGDAALVWIGPVTPGDPPDKRRLAARATLLQGDARSTIALIDGLGDAEAESLRAKALIQLDDSAAAALALAAAGEAEAAARVSPWTGDWTGLDPALPDPWLKAADIVAAAPGDDGTGLLGRGGKAVEASVASRAAIEALLTSVVSPSVD